MAAILGEGEPATLAEPHRLPKDKGASLSTSPPLTQRGNTLDPLGWDRPGSLSPARNGSLQRNKSIDRNDSLNRITSDAIGAYQPTWQAAKDAQMVPRALQQQIAMLDHQMGQGLDEVSQLRQQCMVASRDAAAAKAELNSLKELLHGMQQSNAALQARARHQLAPYHHKPAA